MSETPYSSQNLAGILAVASGLEAADGRSEFSGNDRETLRRALDDESQPGNFAELLSVLERNETSEIVLSALRGLADEAPAQSLQEFAQTWAKGGN